MVEGLKLPEVEGEWSEQAGQAIVVATCPQCGTMFGLSGYSQKDGVNRHMCRTCWNLCRVVAPDKPQVTDTR